VVSNRPLFKLFIENILYAKKEKVATITLNRQQSLNALNTALLTELRDALEDAETDAVVRAIVITGSGEKAFCAGADIEELLEKSSMEASEWSRWVQGRILFGRWLGTCDGV
jgi:enoyl-CoA hydratase